MKLKAVLHRGCPSEVVTQLESNDFNQRIRKQVLSHLGAQSFGSAEFYIQECDFAVGDESMCEVRLTGVSVTKNRSTKNFEDALKALEHEYENVLKPHFSAEQPLQLLVSMMLDQAPYGYNTPHLERPAFYISQAERSDVGC